MLIQKLMIKEVAISTINFTREIRDSVKRLLAKKALRFYADDQYRACSYKTKHNGYFMLQYVQYEFATLIL